MNPDDTPADGNRPSASVTPASEAPAAPNPSVPEMLQAIMARFIFIQQEEINKATSDRLAALAAALGTLDGKNDREETARRSLFATANPNLGIERPTNKANPTNGEVAEMTEGSDSLTSRQIADLQLSLRDIHSTIHHVKASTPEIERVLATTRRNPFTKHITTVKIKKTEKLSIPPYKGDSDPTDHMTAFNIAMGRNHFSDEESDAGLCQLFIESLSGPALSWFSHLKEGSIDSFDDLSASFLKNYMMWSRQGISMADLWKLSQSQNESLKDFMEKFKGVLSKVRIPDHPTVEALTNALWINSKFRDYLGNNPTIIIEDALHDSKNFIKMDEDRRAYNAKQQALKTTASKTSDAQEPRQHAPYRRKGPIYAISKDDQSGAVTAVREPGWNVWERGTEGKTQLSRKAASANPKSSYDQKKFCKYHDMNGHDTKECRHLYEAWLASTSDGRTEPEPSKPKTIKNSKSWSKSKDKKKKSNEKKEEDSPPADEGDQSRPDEESTSDEEKPKSRRKILTIRAMPSPAPSITAKPEDDLCQSSYQKSAQTIESLTSTDSTLMEIDGTPTKIIHSVGKLNASDARYILDAKRKDPLH
ncbi:PREDICTED: uncharacterized protein LOC106302569 [Brassica oleracea var. oleracea]|uniref:uncharacterized protein LOC106302569 n=1 Tax=Brassica oleracea var. oleracea TaxID=109376 RepID=UPI0006A6BEB7|nr:PREDICTED: uncharacterized protein LOC106302569 [Brassica oleracea var. oleracea]